MASWGSRMMMRRAWISVVLLVLGSAPAACTRTEPDTVVVVTDLSGPYEAIGQSILFGARFAEQKVAESSNGGHFRLRELDDRGRAKDAERIAFKVASDPTVLAVIGHATSATTGAAQRVYARYNVPLFIPAATNPSLTVASTGGKAKNTFRMVPSDDLQALRIAEFTKLRFKAKRVVVLHDDSLYGEPLGRTLTRTLRELEIEVPVTLMIDRFMAGVTYGDVFRKAREFSPEAMIFAGYYSECAALVSQFRALGYLHPIILTDGCYQGKFLDGIGRNPSLVFVAFVAPDWATVAAVGELYRSFRQLVGPDDPTYAPFAADAFTLIDAARKRLRAQHRPVDRASIRTLLRSNPFPSLGMAGGYSFDDAGENTSGRNYVFHIETRKGTYRFVQEED